MKSPASSAATLKFASPEINVGLDAVKGPKKKAMPMAAPMDDMPKDKKMIMPSNTGSKQLDRKEKNTPKRLPKRRK